jgi:inorganic pyrophosphatase
MQKTFWDKFESLVTNSEIIIDRPKGTAHPKYPAMIYPFDYGYLKDTSGGDGNEIDVWHGSKNENSLDAIVCTVDILKKDSEIKLLIGCTEAEQNEIVSFLNESQFMSAILVERK